MTSPERPTGGGRDVDHSVGNARTVRAGDKKVTPTKGHNLVIWLFVGFLIVAIVFAVVGVLAD